MTWFLPALLLGIPLVAAALIAVLVFVMPELMEMLGGWMGGGR